VAGTFFLAVLATRHRHLLLGPVRAVGLDAWGWGLAVFVAVFTVLFTTFLTHPGGLWDGIYTGLKYWLSQHRVGRGGEAHGFYLVVLLGVEWPAVLLGAVGAVVALRRPSLLRVFLVWDFVLSLAVYTWAGEKFAWLVLHPLLPLLLLAGIGVQAIWESRRRWPGRLGLVAAALALAYAGYASFLVNAEHRADPREVLVSTQSSEQVADRAGRSFSVTVDAADGATFPYAWYFRDLNVGYVDLSQGGAPPASDVLILTQASRDRLQGQLGAYSERRFAFRVWWVRDYSKLTAASAWRWLIERTPWNATGGMPEWLYVKR